MLPNKLVKFVTTFILLFIFCCNKQTKFCIEFPSESKMFYSNIIKQKVFYISDNDTIVLQFDSIYEMPSHSLEYGNSICAKEPEKYCYSSALYRFKGNSSNYSVSVNINQDSQSDLNFSNSTEYSFFVTSQLNKQYQFYFVTEPFHSNAVELAQNTTLNRYNRIAVGNFDNGYKLFSNVYKVTFASISFSANEVYFNKEYGIIRFSYKNDNSVWNLNP